MTNSTDEPDLELSDALVLPEGLNYECTGCGKCCGGWAIPMTQTDYERITEVNWGEKNDKFKNKSLFRELKDYEMANTPYSYAIKPGDNGHCPFLVDNLCFMHSLNGPKFKPSICQLFPYSFNQTPTGTYATISFVSMGAVNNSGKALSEQREYLESKFEEFKALYPEHKPNWSQVTLATGVPLSWSDYIELEKELLICMKDENKTFEERFIAGSDILIAEFNKRRQRLGSQAQVNNSLNWQDAQLLKSLHKIYFPVKMLSRGEGDFNFYKFILQIFSNGAFPFRVALPGNSYSLEQLSKVPFPQEDPDIQSLIYRYFFSRLFGKHYFGAGYGQLSVITGFHHLAILYALLKLQSKASCLSRDAAKVSYLDVVASIRQLEKRLGEASLDGMAAATFELLMFSPNRMRRILACG